MALRRLNEMEKVFGIIPASSGSFTAILVITALAGLILLGVLGLFISFGYSARNIKFVVNDEGLRIGPGIYGRFIPKEDIDTDGVKVVNLNVDSEYAPKARTNGAGLPGYAAGWFKLANKEKALMFVTDRSRVVYVPTNKDYSVLLSVEDTEQFAGVLRDW
jgi:hypothetical protein